MSHTSGAVVRRIRGEFPTIDAVCRQLERQVDPTETESVVAFAEIFLSKATKEFLQARSADAHAHVTLGAWQFLQDSRPDRVEVEVFNPEVDTLRAYAAYAFQLGVVPSRLSFPTTLRSHPNIARTFFDISEAKLSNDEGARELPVSSDAG
jgi:NAD-specific glutamate dehydrogenase